MAITFSSAFSWTNLALLTGIYISYQLLKILYRITLHPLAKFPGPKLAAATFYYEFYFDGIKGGSYIHQISKMHDEYGPLVRISPNELHCNDPSFIDTIYAGPGSKRDKSVFFLNGFGPKLTGSVFATPSHELHRRRRAAINRYFSKASITKMEPHVHDLAQTLCTKILAQKSKGVPFDVTHAYSQFTTDVITSYCFGQSRGLLEHERVDYNLRGGVLAGCFMLPVTKQWPGLFHVVDNLPDRVAKALSPEISMNIEHNNDIRKHVRELKVSLETGKESALLDRPSIFRDLFESNLPDSEKTVFRLVGEAAGLIGAGSETTAWTLSVVTTHLLENPEMLSKVQAELKSIVKDLTNLPKWSELEKLPYFGAVITEAIRLSYGVATRLARIAPDDAMHYSGVWNDESVELTIPPGTPVGMTNVLIHANETIFPKADQYLPERWLNADSTRRIDLEKYLLSFSRGTRQCIGMNLAYCELHVALAALILRVFPLMKLYETTVDDVTFHRDVFVSFPKITSKGVRVVIE